MCHRSRNGGGLILVGIGLPATCRWGDGGIHGVSTWESRIRPWAGWGTRPMCPNIPLFQIAPKIQMSTPTSLSITSFSDKEKARNTDNDRPVVLSQLERILRSNVRLCTESVQKSNCDGKPSAPRP